MLDVFAESSVEWESEVLTVPNVCRQKSTLFLEKNDDDVKCMFADSLIRASKLSECAWKSFSDSHCLCVCEFCVYFMLREGKVVGKIKEMENLKWPREQFLFYLLQVYVLSSLSPSSEYNSSDEL